MKVLILGHVTYDHIRGKITPGGPPNYQIPFFKQKNVQLHVITSCREDYELPYKPDKLDIIFSTNNTEFEFIFKKNNRKIIRDLKLLSQAEKLHYSNINKYLDEFYDLIICSPVYDEINTNTVERLNSHSNNIVIDIQGFLRDFSQPHIPKSYKKDIMIELNKNTKIIKFSKREFSIVEPFNISPVSEWIVTDGGKNIEVLRAENKVTLMSKPVNQIIDDTGSGDIFLAAYSYYRYSHDIREACIYADSMARQNLQKLGIPNPSDFD